MRADKAARASNPRIKEVRASYHDELRNILVVGIGRDVREDSQLARIECRLHRQDRNQFRAREFRRRRPRGARLLSSERRLLKYFAKSRRGKRFCNLTPAKLQLETWKLLLGPGWPGVLLHEAVGHDSKPISTAKQTSAFAGLIRQKSRQREMHRGRQRHHAVAAWVDQTSMTRAIFPRKLYSLRTAR